MGLRRIIAAGEELKSSVIVSSALPYRFDDEWAETGDQPLSKNTVSNGKNTMLNGV